jgi:hypothetical protein
MTGTHKCRATIAVILCAWTLGAFAEPAVTIKALDLRQKPAADAESIAKLPAETPVELVKREGAWVELKAGSIIGWAKVFDIRIGTAGTVAAKGTGGSGIADTLNLASGNRGSSVSTGVRGLDAAMLEQAQPNFQQVTVLSGYAASPRQATEFARTGKLTARQVELLPPPQTVQQAQPMQSPPR